MRAVSNSAKAAVLGLAAVALAGVSPAIGQSAEKFYEGKALTIIVGTSPGGGYDTYTRTLARHFPRHMPGAPNVVVRNMPGAGSLNAVLYLDATAPADGTHITAFNPGIISDALSDGAQAKARFTDYHWLGSITRDFRVCYAWHAAGIRNWDDLVKRRETVFGATGVNSNSYNGSAMLRNIFNLNVKSIHAYPGNKEVLLAVERGEIDGSCLSFSSLPDHWLERKQVNILVKLSPAKQEGVPDSVPFLGDLAKSQEDKDLIDYLMATAEVGRPYIVSRKVPMDRVALLRAAFDATMKDAQFLEETKKQGLTVDPINGAESEKIVSRLYSFPPALIERGKAALK